MTLSTLIFGVIAAAVGSWIGRRLGLRAARESARCEIAIMADDLREAREVEEMIRELASSPEGLSIDLSDDLYTNYADLTYPTVHAALSAAVAAKREREVGR